MKTVSLFSSMAMIVIIIAVIFALPAKKEVTYKASIKTHQRIQNSVLQQRIQAINQIAEKSSQNSISDTEYNLKISELLREIDNLRNQIEPGSNTKTEYEDPFVIEKFWIKLVFSGIFCVAALFVILSDKYKEDTKKWAVSVLTLIAGVWIGTVS
jgi:hypothetical protein